MLFVCSFIKYASSVFVWAEYFWIKFLSLISYMLMIRSSFKSTNSTSTQLNLECKCCVDASSFLKNLGHQISQQYSCMFNKPGCTKKTLKNCSSTYKSLQQAISRDLNTIITSNYYTLKKCQNKCKKERLIENKVAGKKRYLFANLIQMNSKIMKINFVNEQMLTTQFFQRMDELNFLKEIHTITNINKSNLNRHNRILDTFKPKFDSLELRLKYITSTIERISSRFQMIEMHNEKLLTQRKIEALNTKQNLDNVHSDMSKCLEITNNLEFRGDQLKKNIEAVKEKLDTLGNNYKLLEYIKWLEKELEKNEKIDSNIQLLKEFAYKTNIKLVGNPKLDMKMQIKANCDLMDRVQKQNDHLSKCLVLYNQSHLNN